MKTLKLIAALSLLLLGHAASAQELRIAAWNIENLHHEAGIELRENIGTRRDERDFPILVAYANQFGADATPADLIALQEIGTMAAAERLFPPDDYLILMSERYHNDQASGIEGRIYTAIAIRKESGIELVEQRDIDALSILHEGRPTRSAATALLEFNGIRFWFSSLHLKSSCSTVRNAHTSTNDDCMTFWAQGATLTDWIAERRTEGTPFILAGDFNRRFRQFQNEGPFWERINGGDLNEPWLSQHPEFVTRKCPTRKGSSTQPIDWILLDASVAHWFVEGSFWERRFRQADIDAAGRGDLSDHCPISIDLLIE